MLKVAPEVGGMGGLLLESNVVGCLPPAVTTFPQVESVDRGQTSERLGTRTTEGLERTPQHGSGAPSWASVPE